MGPSGSSFRRRNITLLPKTQSLDPLHLRSSPSLIFCSRTTAAALLQSLALIHTSDPPDTLSALPQCTSAQKLSQTHLAFSLSLIPPSLFGPLSFSRHPHGSSPASFICYEPFFLELSKFPPFLSLYSSTAHLTKVSPNLLRSLLDRKWRHRGRPRRSSRSLFPSDLHEENRLQIPPMKGGGL